MVLSVLKTVLSSFKALLKDRPQRRFLWIFVAIVILVNVAGQHGNVTFMFYQLTYKMDLDTWGRLISASSLSASVSQLLIVPTLSLKLGLRDTTIMILAFVTNFVAYLVEAVNDQVWVLFLSYTVLQLFWSNLYSLSFAAISKLVEPMEIGKVFGVLTLTKALITLMFKPIYLYIYQATLATLPALTYIFPLLCFTACLGLVLVPHLRMPRHEVSKD